MVETQKCLFVCWSRSLLLPSINVAHLVAQGVAHIYIYRCSMGVINNDANIAPSLDGEKLHVGCCVCVC
jgi:hypothetical protein